jgi:hypothetical protein
LFSILEPQQVAMPEGLGDRRRGIWHCYGTETAILTWLFSSEWLGFLGVVNSSQPLAMSKQGVCSWSIDSQAQKIIGVPLEAFRADHLKMIMINNSIHSQSLWEMNALHVREWSFNDLMIWLEVSTTYIEGNIHVLVVCWCLAVDTFNTDHVGVFSSGVVVGWLKTSTANTEQRASSCWYLQEPSTTRKNAKDVRWLFPPCWMFIRLINCS